MSPFQKMQGTWAITTDFLFNALFGLTYINTPITKLAVVTITKKTTHLLWFRNPWLRLFIVGGGGGTKNESGSIFNVKFLLYNIQSIWWIAQYYIKCINKKGHYQRILVMWNKCFPTPIIRPYTFCLNYIYSMNNI